MLGLRGFAVAMTMLLLAVAAPAARSDDALAQERATMVKVIEAYRAQATRLLGPQGFDPRVLAVMGTVPRHAFIPESQQDLAYGDHPVAIGFGQTISQPLIVALMTDLLRTRPDHRVLEIGTGSGYQAAVLARLVQQVYTIEIVAPLAERARTTLSDLGYDNVEVRAGDGYEGWQEAAPFDGILVTAGADHIPPKLVEQLKPGARMVIPVGGPNKVQQLTLIEAKADGSTEIRELLAVRFVPLTGR